MTSKLDGRCSDGWCQKEQYRMVVDSEQRLMTYQKFVCVFLEDTCDDADMARYWRCLVE
jgi:hypothetical protein